jgi:hypothetical protein
MSLANPLWGAPRIHGELLKLGIDIGQTSVAKYMAWRRRPPSQGWRTFLRNHADGIAAMDLFVVRTISFRLLYGLLILRHDRRRILWMGVTAHPTAEWIAQQVVEACAWEWPPTYILRDRDRTYGEAFARRICAMGIRDRPTDVVVLGEQHLRHILLVVPELLQRPAHALVVGQRCAGSTRSAGSWQNCTDADPRRATSPIPPDLIYGRDRESHLLATRPARSAGFFLSRALRPCNRELTKSVLSLMRSTTAPSMIRAARKIALQALHNYLAGDLELTPDDVGEVLTMALARALALALAEGRMAEAQKLKEARLEARSPLLGTRFSRPLRAFAGSD